MKKGKRGGIIVVLVLLAVIFLPSIAGWLIPSRGPKDEEQEATKYSITYQGVSYYSGELIDIYDGMYAENGAYPTEGVAFTRVKISDLNGRMNEQPVDWEGWEGEEDGESWEGVRVVTGVPVCDENGYEHGFYGWYLDAACTKEFRGELLLRGDTTLYARIDVAFWVGPY